MPARGKRVEVLYFASLRDAAGVDSETVDSGAPDLATLYEEARDRLEEAEDRLSKALSAANNRLYFPANDPVDDRDVLAAL